MANPNILRAIGDVRAIAPSWSIDVYNDETLSVESGCIVASVDVEGAWWLGDDDAPDMEGPMSYEDMLETVRAMADDAGI